MNKKFIVWTYNLLCELQLDLQLTILKKIQLQLHLRLIILKKIQLQLDLQLTILHVSRCKSNGWGVDWEIAYFSASWEIANP